MKKNSILLTLLIFGALLVPFLFSGCSSSVSADVYNKLADDFDALQISVEDKNNKVNSLTSEIVLLKEENVKYNDKVNSLISEITSLKDETAKLKEETAKLKEENTSLKKEKNEFEGLKEKYKELSEAEALAQIEATKLKTEEDRIAFEQLKTEELAKKEAEEAAKKAAAEAEEKIGYETGITYEQLARTPNDYMNKKVKFKGYVIQVSENEEVVILRVAIDSDYNKVVMVHYPNSLLSSRILEHDMIIFYGVSKGLFTYEATMGANITVPLIEIAKIELQ